MKEKFKKIIFSNKFIFIFFVVLVFIAYRQLFQSYFEADEWFHFTYYLPIIDQSNGFIITLFKTISDADSLSRGQHVLPIGEEIFFLNTKFFGTNFFPYAFMSLLLHSINSFLIFLFTKELFDIKPKKQKFKVIIFALLGGIFFALSPLGMHAVTWAAFYGQNVLSVTFFLLSLISFKMAFNTNRKKFLYFSILFLFLGLLTKETVAVLFLLLPVVSIVEKRVFPIRYLVKLFTVSLIIFIFFRFIVPSIYLGVGELANKWTGSYISNARQSVESDTRTIVSRDLSIHKNLKQEILFRTATFPAKMLGTIFLSRETVSSIVKYITPIIYPVPPGGDSADASLARNLFMYGPGLSFVIYFTSIIILIFCLGLFLRSIHKNQRNEASTILVGLAIILFAALPLVPIVLNVPRWGYDIYFDSRYYYMPSVGAAILFPFILFSIGEFLSRNLKGIKITLPPSFIILFLFLLWIVNNMGVFNYYMHTIVDSTGTPRKKIITQMKQYLPVLPANAVIYSETDGQGAYGPILPFQTSFTQILTVVYYPFPNSFYNKFIFGAKPEGYFFSEGRGLGVYRSKESLLNALSAKQFSVDDIYGFYYDSQRVKLKNITKSIRKEMKDSLDKI